MSFNRFTNRTLRVVGDISPSGLVHLRCSATLAPPGSALWQSILAVLPSRTSCHYLVLWPNCWLAGHGS